MLMERIRDAHDDDGVTGGEANKDWKNSVVSEDKVAGENNENTYGKGGGASEDTKDTKDTVSKEFVD